MPSPVSQACGSPQSIEEFDQDSYGLGEQIATRFGMSCHLGPERPRCMSVRTWNVGTIRTIDIRMAHCSVAPVRDHRCDASDPPMLFKVVFDGSLTIEQGGFHRTMRPGDLFVLDPRQAFTETAVAPVHMACLSLPRQALAERGDPSRIRGRVLPDMEDADTLAVRDLVCCFVKHSHAMSPGFGLRMERQLLDLVQVIVPEAHLAERPTGRQTTLHRAQGYLARHFSDPALDSGAISRELGISANYLNRLFRTENTTVMRHVWDLRLDHARHMLTRHPVMRVDEVAYASGFSDAAHFSRAYRRRFGTTPSGTRHFPSHPDR